MPCRIEFSFILAAATGAVLLAACNEAFEGAADGASGRETEIRTVLQRISQECGLPAGSLDLMGGEDIHLQPPPDATYQSVDCALRRLRQNRLTDGMSMGFVGNERLEK